MNRKCGQKEASMCKRCCTEKNRGFKVTEDYKWLHNLGWADDRDLFHSSSSKSCAADFGVFWVVKLSPVDKNSQKHKGIQKDAHLRRKWQKHTQREKDIHSECQWGRSGAPEWLCYRFMCSDIPQMVWISQGGGASTRSREVTWPSACHLGKQSNRHVKLPLQCNNPEAATAAVIEDTEARVLP